MLAARGAVVVVILYSTGVLPAMPGEGLQDHRGDEIGGNTDYNSAHGLSPASSPRIRIASMRIDMKELQAGIPRMDDVTLAPRGAQAVRPRLDFQEHLADLEARGLLVRIDHPVDKDSELHPLVRLQFLGGIPEAERRAFLFTNVVDASGRRYDIPVVVGAIAASADIYALGMG